MNIFTGEMIGTGLLILLGDGVVANVVLNKTKGNNSGWIVITFGWAIAVFVGAVSGFAYAFEQSFWKPWRLWHDWYAWFVPLALSYVIFTPVIVLLATADKAALRRNWRPLAAGMAPPAATLQSAVPAHE